MNTCAGCCETVCTARATLHKIGKRSWPPVSSLKLTRGSACSCVWRGHIKGEHIVATVHGDDITIGGERSKGLELERANRSATPCAVDRRDEGKEESRHGQTQTQTEHGWSNATVTTGTDHRWQTMTTPTAKHLQVVTSRSAEHSWCESATCDKIDQISSLRQCRYAMQWQSQRCATWNASRGSDDTSLESRGRGAGSAVVNWRHTQMLTARPLEDPCRRGSS